MKCSTILLAFIAITSILYFSGSHTSLAESAEEGQLRVVPVENFGGVLEPPSIPPQSPHPSETPPTPTPTPTMTPTSEPTPTPQNGCSAYQLDFNIIEGQGQRVHFTGNGNRQPACLSGIIDQAIALGRASQTQPGMCFGVFCRARYKDNCAVAYLLDDPYWKPGCGIRQESPWTPYRPSLNAGWEGGIRNATVYLDENCNALTNSEEIFRNGQPCDVGEIRWTSTPLSLVWSEGHDVDKDVRIVTFPVDPNRKGEWFLWKASAKAPLLVFDPEHSGVVRSARQLFGNWTFGGKQFATQSKGARSSMWRDGFEPLATIDHNSDGEISGEELQPLALWFDRNQDGVSDQGEVVPMRSTDIEALYYSGEMEHTPTGNTTLRVGFKRTSGKMGSIVDWRSDSSIMPGTLVNKHLQSFSLNTASKTLDSILSDESVEDVTQSEQGRQSEEADIDGFWAWKVTESKNIANFKASGYLSFSEIEDGTIEGFSYGEIVPNNPQQYTEKVNSVVSITPLVGKITHKHNSTTLRFALETSGEREVKSKVTLSEDGSTLFGKTAARVSYNGSPMTISYHWVAKKLKH